MSEKRWKAQERRVARLLGGVRSHNKGEASPDISLPWLVVEVKDRGRFPGWIQLALDQAAQHASSTQLPIVVLTGAHVPRDLVVLDLRDFRDWFGPEKRGK